MAAKRATPKPAEDAPKKGPGRGTIRTPETRAALLDAIGLGLSDKAACEYAGIGSSAFYEWIKADSQFSDDLSRARGAFIREHQRQIASQARQDWRASAWLLSRRRPEDYAERQIVSVEGQADSPLDRFFGTKAEGDDPPDA